MQHRAFGGDLKEGVIGMPINVTAYRAVFVHFLATNLWIAIKQRHKARLLDFITEVHSKGNVLFGSQILIAEEQNFVLKKKFFQNLYCIVIKFAGQVYIKDFSAQRIGHGLDDNAGSS